MPRADFRTAICGLGEVNVSIVTINLVSSQWSAALPREQGSGESLRSSNPKA